METPVTLELLYTHRIRGDLSLLPRLHTFITRLKAARNPRPTHRLLVDLGESCVDEVWPCTVTGGRSTLMVFDAMGYSAANVTSILDAESRDRLKENNIGVALIDDDHPHTDSKSGVRFGTSRGESDAPLQIILLPSAPLKLVNKILYLPAIETNQVGSVSVSMGNEPELIEYAVHSLPASTLPNPTIAAAVEFVESEARYYESQQQSKENSS